MIADITAAFKTLLEQIDGVQVYDYVPDQANWPCIIVYPEGATIDVPSVSNFVLWCLVGKIDEQGAQTKLSDWLSPDGSVIQALDTDNTLGGAVDSCIPREIRNWGISSPQEGRAAAWQAELICEVIT